jgi:hypothetical protein
MHRALLKAPPNHHVVIYTSSFHVWECFELWFVSAMAGKKVVVISGWLLN